MVFKNFAVTCMCLCLYLGLAACGAPKTRQSPAMGEAVKLTRPPAGMDRQRERGHAHRH